MAEPALSLDILRELAKDRTERELAQFAIEVKSRGGKLSLRQWLSLKWFPFWMRHEAKRVGSEEDLVAGARHGDPYLQPLFAGMIETACNLAREMRLPVKSLGTIGVLPIGTPNAMAIKVPGTDDTLVVFQQGLPLFLNRMIKITLSLDSAVPANERHNLDFNDPTWPERYRLLVRRTADLHPDVADQLLELLKATIFSGNPNVAPPHHVSALIKPARQQLLYHTEMFIIGHEIGHSILGHLEGGSKAAVSRIGDTAISTIKLEHIQEYQADMLGFLIADASAKKIADTIGLMSDLQVFCFTAPDFFFSAIACLEEFMALAHGGWSSADSHPTSLSRRGQRRKFLESVNNERALDLGRRLEVVICELSDRVRESFVQLVQSEVAMSPAWVSR